jgi:hypothetical protein
MSSAERLSFAGPEQELPSSFASVVTAARSMRSLPVLVLRRKRLNAGLVARAP